MIVVATNATVDNKQLPIDMRFDPQRPIEIVFVFRTSKVNPNHSDLEWVFSRDLLIQSIQGDAGEGDVVFRSHNEDRTNMYLSSSNGECTVCIEESDIIRFLELTLSAVPEKDESNIILKHLAKWIKENLNTIDGEP